MSRKKNDKIAVRLIRNSTAEFLIFTGQAGDQSIEARYEDETVWLSQKLMAELFSVSVPTINIHLKNIYETKELQIDATIRNFQIVQKEGGRSVVRQVDFYNLDAIISVGYRINSVRATQFRQWATQVLREFAIKGYVTGILGPYRQCLAGFGRRAGQTQNTHEHGRLGQTVGRFFELHRSGNFA